MEIIGLIVTPSNFPQNLAIFQGKSNCKHLLCFILRSFLVSSFFLFLSFEERKTRKKEKKLCMPFGDSSGVL